MIRAGSPCCEAQGTCLFNCLFNSLFPHVDQLFPIFLPSLPQEGLGAPTCLSHYIVTLCSNFHFFSPFSLPLPIFFLAPPTSPSFSNSSKGSYCSWKKIVKGWMMMMMKEGVFAGHPSLALPPSTFPHLPLPCLTWPHSTHPCPAYPCKLKWQNAS